MSFKIERDRIYKVGDIVAMGIMSEAKLRGLLKECVIKGNKPSNEWYILGEDLLTYLLGEDDGPI
jgi:hypothetical protein